MIVEPDLRIPDFAKAGADIISVHAETASTIHLHRSVNMVRRWPGPMDSGPTCLMKPLSQLSSVSCQFMLSSGRRSFAGSHGHSSLPAAAAPAPGVTACHW
jgi:hypothetical protein